MAIDHWMTFGTFSEQRYFSYPAPDTYKGVIINANMIAHARDGMAAFLMEKTNGLAYLIDPQTHAYQHNVTALLNKDGDVKSSLGALAGHYGEPVVSNVGIRPLLPGDFNGNVLPKFVERCVLFQENYLAQAMADSDANKYLEQPASALQPYGVVAPYFYMTEQTVADWLAVNLDCVRLAKNKGKRIFAPIVISQGALLNDQCRKQLSDEYSKLKPYGVVIWIDDLDEHQAGTNLLTALISLTDALRASGINEIINLHGGYFSVLLAGSGGGGRFTGVAHGPEFGEHRAVVPVGGGIPRAKYYVHQLHARVRYREAVAIFRSKGWLESASAFHANVCDCPECIKTLDGNPANFTLFGESVVRSVKKGFGLVRMEFPTGTSKQRCLRHYLERKVIEYKFMSASKKDLLDDLKQGSQLMQSVVGLEGVSHLRVWLGLLDKL